MRECSVSSVAELKSAIKSFGSGLLYRGQTKHYGEGGHPSVIASFDRNGCIPPEMLKWSHYAENILRHWFGAASDSIEFNQALLQHYGWRSFYIDVSSSAAVASWFASHKYIPRDATELCEDCDERPVILRKKKAEYLFTEEIGHLYVVNPLVAARSTGLIDLSFIDWNNHRPRFKAQCAWLIGPLPNKPLSSESYLGHIVGTRSTFNKFAVEFGFDRTGELFPSRSEDPVLASLLDLPWREIGMLANGQDGIPIFRRAIDLPEYENSYQKILSPRIALFRNAKIANIESVDGMPEKNIVITVPSTVIMGTADPAPNRFPIIMSLLKQYTCATFEIDDIIKHTSQKGNSLYIKGVSVMNREDHLIEVGELMVEHPGMTLTRAGHVVGWYYEVSDKGIWTRRHHVNECPCGSDQRHLGHVSALHIIEYFLSQPNRVG